MRGLATALIASLLASATCAHALRVYKWSDGTGVNYSDRPPASGARKTPDDVETFERTERSADPSSRKRARRHSPTQPLQSHEDVERRKSKRASRRKKGSSEYDIRSIDGGGNNASNPDWGRADIELLRLTLSDYADDVGAPAGQERPGARAISNAVLAQSVPIPNSAGVSDFVWQWGQFLDHDLDLTPTISPIEPFDIAIPAGDPFFDPQSGGTETMPFDRSLYAKAGLVRQQTNLVTAFVDASNVYGSDPELAEQLRTLDGTGRLRVSDGELLPFDSDEPSVFLAGDVRANETIALTAMHTLFVREHNYWADRFRAEQFRLDGEEIYQKARMMVAAEIQAITYEEFLPVLLGPNALAPYDGYKPDVNPGISNEFATASYRFGHSMVSPQLLRLDRKNEPVPAGHVPLRAAFFNPGEVVENGIDSLLRGLAAHVAQEIDALVIDDLRNFLFGAPGDGGFDLAALNIQRGRDHGLPSFNDTRRHLGLAPRTGFADVSPDPEVQARLASIYGSVEEIDLWVGGLAEEHVDGALVGETIHIVVRDQFERLRDGDRFWYRIHLPKKLLEEVEKLTLADVIRRNTDIGREIQDNVFVVPEEGGRGAGRRRQTSIRTDSPQRQARR